MLFLAQNSVHRTKKTILIAFRGSESGQKNEDRDHFGSVTEINNKLVPIASQLLIESYIKQIRNKNRNSVIDLSD